MDYSTLKLSSDFAAIEGKVYDLRKFSKFHPGGTDILLYVGRNATPHFHMHHPHMSPAILHAKLKNYYVGEYKESFEDCADKYYFNSPFAIELLDATRPYVTKKLHIWKLVEFHKSFLNLSLVFYLPLFLHIRSKLFHLC